ncbi:hypothetical protein K8R78_07965 [bacterium]|nr:hypothetical protein [bacterium]
MRRYGLLLLILLIALPAGASYYFELPRMVATVAINPAGDCDIYYELTFANRSWSQPVDVVDIGLPNDGWDITTAAAWQTSPMSEFPAPVRNEEYEAALAQTGDEAHTLEQEAITQYGQQCQTNDSLVTLNSINNSEYVEGVEVWLDEPLYEDEAATLFFQIKTYHFIYPDDDNDDYASVEFAPTWFGSEFVSGNKDLTVKIVFPPGVTPEETIYHGREYDYWTTIGEGESEQIVFVWNDPYAGTGYQADNVGVSFPRKYLADDAVYVPSALEEFFVGLWMFIVDIFEMFGYCILPIGFFIISALASFFGRRRRRMRYLPPSASVEGIGIKRGLTAVEAAVVMELKLDRILNMIMFGLIRKGRIEVTDQKPLKLRRLPVAGSVGAAAATPKLYTYELKFLEALDNSSGKLAKGKLRTLFVSLISAVNKKLKGFSRKETREYYRAIVEKAWKQVEAGENGEIKMEAWDRELEWVLIDKDFNGRTRRAFGDLYVPYPHWWGRYYPSYGGGGSFGGGGSVGTGGGSGGGSAPGRLPHLPGSQFANDLANGASGFAGGILGDVSSFTGSVTSSTNPVPVSSSSGGYRGGSSSGGGSSCACACACAGCACACAGGGR